jgi:hypothetical protein
MRSNPMRDFPSLFLAATLGWIAFVIASSPAETPSPPPSGVLKGHIVDGATGQTTYARAYVTDSQGNHYFDPRAIIFKHRRDNERNFSCDGKFEVELPPGKATVRVERGLEYTPLVETVEILPGAAREEKFVIGRWANMAKQGWYSGDLHGHRDLEEMKTLVLAEDVNVGSVITRHNQQDYWKGKKIPETHLVTVDQTHVISQFDEEVEYLGKNTLGALIFIGMKKPIPVSDSNPAYPTLAQFADRCHQAGGFVDAEKPIWLGVAVSAALGQIDSIGIVNNHFHPRSVLHCVGGWGEIVPEKGFQGNDGLALWCMELYYRLLNCGFRIPVSAGTASGIMPSPVGYSRVYVKLPGRFSYDNWVEGLKAGRSFATNGPILSLRVNGHEIGDVIELERPGRPLIVEAEAISLRPLSYLEIVAGGKVIACNDASADAATLTIEQKLIPCDSTWIVARAFEKNDQTARFAHTSPIYIEVAGKPVLSAEAAAYYKANTDKVIEFTAASTLFKNETDRQTALSLYRRARQIYSALQSPPSDPGNSQRPEAMPHHSGFGASGPTTFSSF